MITSDPITITNVLEKSTQEMVYFLNKAILANKLPLYHPNHGLSIQEDLMPLLGRYANDKAYVTELFNVVYAGWAEQKKFKKHNKDNWNEELQMDLEAKKDILYRVWQTLEGMYEACSRMMTGVGAPDVRQSRHV